MNDLQVFQNSEFGELAVLEIKGNPISRLRPVQECWGTSARRMQSALIARGRRNTESLQMAAHKKRQIAETGVSPLIILGMTAPSGASRSTCIT